MLKKGLIGFTGFVGGTLLKQTGFDSSFNTSNISQIADYSFDKIYCAGISAEKWLANKDPDSDLKKIQSLIKNLERVKCNKFILISTVDVFTNPNQVYEDTEIKKDGLQPYGLHRRYFEEFIENHFKDYLIVRLPGLIGEGLKKNIIFDFLNTNNLESIDSRGIFQHYPMINLWSDIEIADKSSLKILHLTSEPITVEEIAQLCFEKYFINEVSPNPVRYDLRTKYASLYGKKIHYQYSREKILQAISYYAKNEPLSLLK